MGLPGCYPKWGGMILLGRKLVAAILEPALARWAFHTRSAPQIPTLQLCPLAPVGVVFKPHAKSGFSMEPFSLCPGVSSSVLAVVCCIAIHPLPGTVCAPLLSGFRTILRGCTVTRKAGRVLLFKA